MLKDKSGRTFPGWKGPDSLGQPLMMDPSVPGLRDWYRGYLKALLEEYAKDVDNVKSVQNDMTIAATPAASTNAPATTASEKIDDASITAQVKASLFAHHSTSALHTGVSTTDGVVTLSGIAKNDAEKSLVSKLANDINGVTDVINNMTVTVPVVAN